MTLFGTPAPQSQARAPEPPAWTALHAATAERPLRFAVIDVETTGLDPLTNRIVEVAVVETDRGGSVIDEFCSLVDVPGDHEPGAGFIHGVSRSMLAGAPSFDLLAGELSSRLAGRIVVGHVVAFDIGHLRLEFGRAGLELPALDGSTLCTRDLARAVLPPGSRTLPACCDVSGIEMRNAHTALGDARATAMLLVHLLDQGATADLADLQHVAGSINWPTTPAAATPLVTKVREYLD